LKVTPDHPVIVVEDGKLVERPADAIARGDRIPLIAGLPESPTPAAFETLDLVSDSDRAVVVLPQSWAPTQELRTALRKVITRADARHYWLARRELPVAAFRQLEVEIGVPRGKLSIRLAGPRSTALPAVIPLTHSFARLIGYYLAEGCCSQNGTTSKIVWTFGRNRRDAEYVEDVISILEKLHVRHSVDVRKSTVAVTVSSRLLARLLTETLRCGSRSSEKGVPSIFMQAPIELQRELLKGVFRGDGSFSFPTRGSRVKVSHFTTSRGLHEQLILLLQSLGVFPSCHVRPPREGRIRGRVVASREG